MKVIVIDGERVELLSADRGAHEDTGTSVAVIAALEAAWGRAVLVRVLRRAGLTDVYGGAVPVIGRVVPSVENTDKAWYERGHISPYNGHPAYAFDWNLESMGDTDLGEPVCAPFAGVVINADDYAHAWGNIVRVLGYDADRDEIVVWMGAHFEGIAVSVGQVVAAGDRIGTIGKGPHGMYPAHLHEQFAVGEVIGPTDFPHGPPLVSPEQLYLDYGVDEELLTRLIRKDDA